jgi:hypothetical protein
MPSDAFIGILSGLGEAHRTRQKNIFDQEVERRSKYEQFLQKASTDPAYRPEAQNQFAELYSTLIQTPYEKKLPKDFERQVTDALTSVEGSMNLQQGGPPQVSRAGALPSQSDQPIAPPGQFKGKMPTRFSADEKFAEAMRLLNAQLQARSGVELETERQKLAMQPEEAFAFGQESGLATRSGKVLREPATAPEKPPNLTNLSREEVNIDGKGPVTVLRQLDPADPTRLGRVFVPTLQGLQEVTGRDTPYKAPVQPPFIIRAEGAITNAAGELPREWRNAVTRAMPSNATPATRLARMNEAASYIDAGDMEGLKSRIRQLAIEGENVGTQAQVEGRADAMNAMKDAVGLIDQMQREGVATNIVTGTWEDILRKLGTTSHPKRVEFASRMQRALSAYTLAMSGVQFSEAEAARYNRLFPNYSNTMPVNKALTNALLTAMETEDRRFWNQKLGPDGAALVGATVGSTGSPLDDEIMRAIRGGK